MDDGIANPEDFRQAALEQALHPPERVVLPASGLPVMLRRPKVIFFALTRHPYPVGVLKKAADLAALLPKERARLPLEQQLSADEVRLIADWGTEVFSAVFHSPKLSLTPGSAEISPNWLLPGDVNFILTWIVGGDAVAGVARPEFQRQSSPLASGASGGDVSLAPVGDPPRDDA